MQKNAGKKRPALSESLMSGLFYIHIGICGACGGDVKIIASIEDPAVIQKILAHLDDKATSVSALLSDCRASQASGLMCSSLVQLVDI